MFGWCRITSFNKIKAPKDAIAGEAKQSHAKHRAAQGRGIL